MLYSVTVKPNSSRSGVVVDKNSISADKTATAPGIAAENGGAKGSSARLTVYTHKSPTGGEANADVIKLLAKHFHVAKGNIIIKKGATSRHKLVEILMP